MFLSKDTIRNEAEEDKNPDAHSRSDLLDASLLSLLRRIVNHRCSEIEQLIDEAFELEL